MMRSWVCLLILLVTATELLAQQQSTDQVFLEGLRERRLYQLAEQFCRETLQRNDLSAEREVGLAIEWSRVLAARARELTPEENKAVWDEASNVLARFQREHRQNPKLLLVRIQAALLPLARGELLIEQAKLLIRNQAFLEAGRAEIRDAVRKLEDLEEEINKLLNQPRPPRGGPTFSENELYSLLNNTRFQLGKAYQVRGESYPAGSADRIDAFNQAIKRFQTLAVREASRPEVWPARIAWAASLRLKGKTADAARLLASWQEEDSGSDRWSAVLKLETVRLLLAEDKLEDADRLLKRIPPTVSPAEVALEELKIQLARWQQAKAATITSQANYWQQQIGQSVRSIQREHGPYWGRKAAALEGRVLAKTSSTSGDSKMLARAASNYFLSKEYEAALEHYDLARNQAKQQGNNREAFNYGYTAAAIEQQRQQHAEAAERFLALADEFPEHAQAPEAHHWAIYHTAQLVRNKAGKTLEDYKGLLEQHVELWPQATTTPEMRSRLAILLEIRKDWEQAARQYMAAVGHTNPAKILVGLQRSALQHLESLPTPEAEANWAKEVATAFEGYVVTPNGNLPERWSDTQRQAALQASRFWMYGQVGNYSRGRELLTAALNDASQADAKWVGSAKLYLALAFAGQGQADEAATLLEQIGQGNPAELVQLLSTLSQMAEDNSLGPALARLQLRAVEMLRPKIEQLSKSQQQLLDVVSVRSTALLEPKRGPGLYQSLYERYPRDADVLKEYAQYMGVQDDASLIRLAYDAWKKLERGSKSGSDRWLMAKYHQAKTLQELGLDQKALKTIQLTKVLYPDLPGWKPQFERLEQSLQD